MKRALLAPLALALAACDPDAILEGSGEKVEVQLGISVASASLNLVPGASVSTSATITRLGAYTGPVEFTFAYVPSGVTASVGATTTTGQVTTATISFEAASTAATGSFSVTVIARADGENKSTSQLSLVIAHLPAVQVAPAKQSVAIIRGGISPLSIILARTNFAGPVTLSASGPQGISVAIAANPVSGTTSATTISVATSLTPGTYTVMLRATGAGIAESSSPLTVVVPPDELQIIADDAAASQASVVASAIVVNRFAPGGAVTLTAEGLPVGVSAAFPPSSDPAAATVRFTVDATALPGTHSVTLRARSAGVADAITGVSLTVTPSNVAMSLVPQNVTLLQGTTAASALQLIRTGYTGTVSVELLAVPAGIVISSSDATVSGESTTLLVQAARDVAPGAYTVSVRVVPLPSTIDGPVLAPVTATLTVTVVLAPTVNANVILDWSGCVAPAWVAAQDGTGPWTRLTNIAGRFAFGLTSVRGGFAWDDGGVGMNVRYLSSTELTAGPINLCPAPAPATFAVNGIASHILQTETATWRLGGGVGTSSSALPIFTIEGVRPGTHDLVGYGNTTAFTTRMVLQRDINEPPGGSVGTVVLGAGFTTSTTGTTITGFAGERMALTLSYLTTAACTENELVQSGSSSVSSSAFVNVPGVPPAFQRETDFHLVSVVATGTNIVRTASVSYNRATPTRAMALPPATPMTFFTVPGTHLRMRVVVTSLPAEFNRGMTLRFTSGGRSVAVTASAATFQAGVVNVDFPELGGVGGFPAGSVPPVGAHGTFSAVLEGSSGEPTLCAEGASRRALTRSGPF